MARYAEDARARTECPIHKGPLDECSDPAVPHYPQRLVCRKTMSLAAAQRKWESLHADEPFHDGTFRSWVKEWSESHPFHYNDGVRLWVADVDYDPDGQWLSIRDGG